MRCDAAGEVLTELAREGVLEAPVRRDALDHAAACPGCARRLAGERALSAALRALASETEVAAPPALERALLHAFRLRHAGPVEAPAARRPGPGLWRRPRPPPPWRRCSCRAVRLRVTAVHPRLRAATRTWRARGSLR